MLEAHLCGLSPPRTAPRRAAASAFSRELTASLDMSSFAQVEVAVSQTLVFIMLTCFIRAVGTSFEA